MGSVSGVAKRKVRTLVDRIALPYVDLVVARSERPADAQRPAAEDAPASAPVGTTTTNVFHSVNHELRTIELERVPKGARRVLSVGANGRWYFDWFEHAVGIVDEHIGVEAYEPMPDDLQCYVTWVTDTADRMVDVASGSVDLVFAGQTTEHLWSAELSGFLLEANRVLASDGVLVLDSPNRLVTEHLLWSHGGHTVELSIDEICELVELAGFDLIDRAGIWSCVVDGRRMTLEEGLDDSALLIRRASTARDKPDDAFIWWINARRNERGPDEARLRARTKELFEQQWPVRLCRGLFPAPKADRLPLMPGDAGVVGANLPFPLKAGAVEVTVGLCEGSVSDLAGFRVRFVLPGDVLVRELRAEDALVRGGALTWTFDNPHLLFATTLQLVVDDVLAPVAVRLPIDLQCDV